MMSCEISLDDSIEFSSPEFDIPLLSVYSDLESSADLSRRELDYSMVVRLGKNTPADSDTVSTCANSSIANLSYLNSSFAINNERPSRCVRFALRRDNEVAIEQIDSEGPLTEDEKALIWWQPAEYKVFRRYCKKAAEAARKTKYVDEFTRVYDACSAMFVADVTELCHISRPHVRGLELVVFPTLCKARKLVVRGVLQTQNLLPESMGEDERAKVLAATSKYMSGRARMLARVLGVGDEEVARECMVDDE
jgi:hypothetical protein